MWSNLTKAVHELQRSFGEVGGSYWPDLHFMRGPGPKWCARYVNLAPKTISTASAPRTETRDPCSRLNDKRMCHAHNIIILLAIVGLGTAVATHDLAAESGANGVHAGGGVQNHHAGNGFRGPLIDRAPSIRPTFNPSEPYTVPQSPEKPVSPASPGSIFGDR